MKCHYEVLNVPRDADEGEIKLSYKKLALRWHPDKNLDDVENATEQFQLVQQAYEILSDRQERAWYDNHREQILRGASSDFKDDTLDVYQYFTTTCFRGYGDDDDGFYAVYRNVFERIAKEDLEFMESKEDFCGIPMFGGSASDYPEIVSPFYAFWTSYSTKKSYAWLDPYSVREAKNRRVLKIIDKENEKIRTRARKERNEEVRGLVAFVRKRDKRVQAHTQLLETKKLENRRKQERISKQRRLERLKLLDESSEQADWMKFENVQSELEEIERSLAQEFGDEISDGEQSTNSEEEEPPDQLYCVACNKIFKNPRAFENHESSRKHKDNVDRLKEDMLLEDEELELNISGDDSVEELSCSEEKTKAKKKNKRAKNVLLTTDAEVDVDQFLPGDSDDHVKETTAAATPQKQKRKKNKPSSANKLNVTEAEVNNDAAKLRSRREDKKNKKSSPESVDVDSTCVACKSTFSSKNKLFDHLKKTGHSVRVEPSAKTERRKKSKEQ